MFRLGKYAEVAGESEIASWPGLGATLPSDRRARWGTLSNSDHREMTSELVIGRRSSTFAGSIVLWRGRLGGAFALHLWEVV